MDKKMDSKTLAIDIVDLLVTKKKAQDVRVLKVESLTADRLSLSLRLRHVDHAGRPGR